MVLGNATAEPQAAAGGPAGPRGLAGILRDGELQSRLERAARALCRLDGAVTASPLADLYLTMQAKREAARSATLAGGTANLTDVLSQGDVQGASAGAILASRCLRALEAATKLSTDLGGPADRLVEIHRILDADGTPGDPSEGGSASPALQEVSDHLDSVLLEAASPMLAHLGLLQAQLEAVAPFPAGNGRLARLLVPVALHRRRGIALGISDYLLGHASEYGALSGPGAASEGRDPWLAFFLQGIAESASQAVDEIARLAALREEHRKAVTASLGHAVPKALRVLDCLLGRPLATVAEIRVITGTSYVAANQLVSRLVDLGILEEVTGFRRNRVFLYGPYVRILDQGRPAEPAAFKTESAPKAKSPKAARKPAAPGSGKPPSEGPDDEAGRPVAAQAGPPSTGRRSPDLADHLL